MGYSYILSPAIGVARVGDSHAEFYLAPTEIGGLPRECDQVGNATGQPFTRFKDADGRVKRQAQDFRIFRTEDNKTFEEVTLLTDGVQAIHWTVHLANKKAAWYQFKELQGNLLLGEDNSYGKQKVPLRNANAKGAQDRQKLIIDPGPRTLSGTKQSVEVSRDTVPSDYPFRSFPNPEPEQGWPINSLGTLKTDSVGRLLILAAYGRAGGDQPIGGYGGADTWYDDIADGPVDVAIQFISGETVTLHSWVICASPDFAPEVVNISTLDDTMFDVAVRYFNLVPDMYSNGSWNTNFVANYQRDILPIIRRISRYQWVANVQTMSAFWSSSFDFSDPSTRNAANRQRYLSYFRQPTIYVPIERLTEQAAQAGTTPARTSSYRAEQVGTAVANRETTHTVQGIIEGGSATLFAPDNVPMMPMNAGSNPVSNVNIEKFLTLSQTQYFLLQQWADGKFTNHTGGTPYQVWPATRAAVGNCVGLPMCPGIEVTWSMQNPAIYAKPYAIAQFGNEASYKKRGLTPSRDETEGGGCEPGDLTKRMAIPWQADFLNCTIQYVNFTNSQENKDSQGRPLPPTYYTYWWPPQSPWDVITGDGTPEQQAASHTPAGVQVHFQRGINSYRQMIIGWSYLGFIRNQNTNETDEAFPYLVETERLHDRFAFAEVPLSEISGNKEDDETTLPVFYFKQEELSVEYLEFLRVRTEEELFHEITMAEDQLLQELPRSGTRVRF